MARYEFEAVLTGRDELSPVLDNASDSIDDVHGRIDSLDGEEARLTIEVNSEETISDIDNVSDRFDSLDGSRATLEVVLDVSDVISDISTVESRLDRVDGLRARAGVDLDIRPFTSSANAVEARNERLDDLQAVLRASLNANQFFQRANMVEDRMASFSETTMEPVMDMETSPFMSDAGMVQGIMDQLSQGFTADAEMDTAGFAASGAMVQGIISSLDGQEIEISTDLDYAPTVAGLNMISNALSGTNDSTSQTSSTFGKFMKRLDDFDDRAAGAFPTAMGDFQAAMERFNIVAAVAQTVRLPGLMQGITVVAGGATAGAAAVGGLAVALTQGLAGGAGVAAGAMGLLGTSLIGTIIPTKQVISNSMEMSASLAEANATLQTADPASKEYAEAMATVGEIADGTNDKFLNFADTVNEFRMQWMVMNREIGERSLPVLTEYVQYATEMLPKIAGTLEMINRGFRQQSQALLGDLRGAGQMEIITRALQEMGRAGEHAFQLLFQGGRLFFNVLTPVLGYSNQLLEYLGMLTAKAADWSATAEGQMAIADTWQKLVMRGQDLWQIVRDLSVGIFQLGTALDQSGLDDDMIEALQYIAGGFRDITTAGTETHTNMMGFFADVRPLLDDVGSLIMTVGREFFTLVGQVISFRREGEKLTVMQEIVQGLEEAVPPLFEALWMNFKRLGPVLADLIAEFTEFFAIFGPADPILVEVLKGFEQMLSLFNELPDEMQLMIGRAIGLSYAFNLLTGGGGGRGSGLLGAAAGALSFGIQMRALNRIAKNTAPPVAGVGGAIGGAGRNARAARGRMAGFGASLASLVVPGRAANRQVAVLTPAMTRAGRAARGAGRNASGAAGGFGRLARSVGGVAPPMVFAGGAATRAGRAAQSAGRNARGSAGSWTALGGAARGSSGGFIASGRAASRSSRQIAQSGAAARTASARYGALGGAARGVGGPMIFAGGAATRAGRSIGGSGTAARGAAGRFGGLRAAAAGLGGLLLGTGAAAARGGRGLRSGGTAARGAAGRFAGLRLAAAGLAGVLGGLGPMALISLIFMFPGAFANMANGALTATGSLLGLATGAGDTKDHMDNLRRANQEVDSGLNELQLGLDDMSAKLIDSVPALKGVEDALNRVDEATSNAAQGIRSWFIKSMEEARADSETTTHSIVGDWQGAKDKLVGNSIIPDIVTGIQDWFIELNNWLVDFGSQVLENVVAPFREAYNTIVGNSIVPDLVKGVEDNLATVPGRASGALAGVEQAIAEPFRRAQGQVASQVTRLSNMRIRGPEVRVAAPQQARQMASQAQQLAGQQPRQQGPVMGSSRSRGDDPVREVKDLSSQVQRFTRRMAIDTEDGAEKVRKGFLKGIQGLSRNGVRDMERLRKGAGQSVDKLRKSVLDDTDDLQKKSLRNIGRLSRGGVKDLGDLNKGGSRSVDRLRKSVLVDTADLSRIGTRNVEKLKRGVLNDMGETQKRGSNLAETLKKNTSRSTNQMRGFVEKQVSGMRRAGVSEFGQFRKGGTKETDSLKNNTTRLTNEMQNITNRTHGEMRKAGVKEFGGLRQGGTRESDTLKKNANRLTDEMRSFTNKQHTDMKDAGIARFTDLQKGGSMQSADLKKNATTSADNMRRDVGTNVDTMKTTNLGRFKDLQTGGSRQAADLKKNAAARADEMRRDVGTDVETMKTTNLGRLGEFRDKGGRTMDEAGRRMYTPVGNAKDTSIGYMNDMLGAMNEFIDQTGVNVPKASPIGGENAPITRRTPLSGRPVAMAEGGLLRPGGVADGPLYLPATDMPPTLLGEAGKEAYVRLDVRTPQSVEAAKAVLDSPNSPLLVNDVVPGAHVHHHYGAGIAMASGGTLGSVGAQQMHDEVVKRWPAVWVDSVNHHFKYLPSDVATRSVDFFVTSPGNAASGSSRTMGDQIASFIAPPSTQNTVWYDMMNFGSGWVPISGAVGIGNANTLAHRDHVHGTAHSGSFQGGQGGAYGQTNWAAKLEEMMPKPPEFPVHIVGDTAKANTADLREAMVTRLVGEANKQLGGSKEGGLIPFTGKWASAVGGGPAENRGIGQAAAEELGWGGQWAAWEELGNRESGWDRFARNPSSGAYGIPQSLPESKLPHAAQSAGGSHAGPQVGWMASYIKESYGDPQGAIGFHNANNWYTEGGIATQPHVAAIADQGPEMFIPLHDPRAAGKLLDLIRNVSDREVISGNGGGESIQTSLRRLTRAIRDERKEREHRRESTVFGGTGNDVSSRDFSDVVRGRTSGSSQSQGVDATTLSDAQRERLLGQGWRGNPTDRRERLYPPGHPMNPGGSGRVPAGSVTQQTSQQRSAGGGAADIDRIVQTLIEENHQTRKDFTALMTAVVEKLSNVDFADEAKDALIETALGAIESPAGQVSQARSRARSYNKFLERIR